MHAITHALAITASMTWEITWALILGFTLAAIVQAVVPKAVIVRRLGDDRPRTLAVATAFGAASSSCSYAAVALARSLFRKGAGFTAAIAFEIASTNLVIELGVILALLMGWQFTAAEFTGGPIMIVIIATVFRLFLTSRLLGEARTQADRGIAGSMEGHAAMDMSVGGSGSITRRLLSRDGFTGVSHVFVMEWAAIIRDLVIGLLVAGAIAAWVPDSFWQGFFFAGHPLAAKLWGPLIGPVVAILSFVCSIGNVPLAVVLWKGGISFGGVIAFIFADLIIAPILNIYRKYYGARMAAFLLGTLFAAMAAAGYVVELVFGGLGLVPDRSAAHIPDEGVSLNYTTWLNIVFLLLAAVLVIRFVRTGGIPMLRMMNGGPDDDHAGHGEHAGHDHHAGPPRRPPSPPRDLTPPGSRAGIRRVSCYPPRGRAPRGGRIAAQVRCGQEWAPSESGVVVRSGGAAPGLARPRAADADHDRDGGGGAHRAGGGAPDRHGGRPVLAVRGPHAGICLGRPRDDGQDRRTARRRLCRGGATGCWPARSPSTDGRRRRSRSARWRCSTGRRRCGRSSSPDGGPRSRARTRRCSTSRPRRCWTRTSDRCSRCAGTGTARCSR